MKTSFNNLRLLDPRAWFRGSPGTDLIPGRLPSPHPSPIGWERVPEGRVRVALRTVSPAPGNLNFRRVLLAVLPLALALAGCSKKEEGDLLKASSPAQAGAGLEQAFQNSSGQIKESATVASEAMRKGEYEKAIVSLHTVRQAPNITLEQGLAIQSSMVTLERDLINAMERGDQNAKRAYELLRRSKRN